MEGILDEEDTFTVRAEDKKVRCARARARAWHGRARRRLPVAARAHGRGRVVTTATHTRADGPRDGDEGQEGHADE